MCLLCLNPNCLYIFRAVPFGKPFGWHAIILLSQQLIEESCFLASPFSKAEDLSMVPVRFSVRSRFCCLAARLGLTPGMMGSGLNAPLALS